MIMKNHIFTVDHDGNQYGVSATFRSQGSELLMLLHGLGCSKESFKDIWSRDEFSNYSIISMDLLGFGDSSKSDKFSYKLEDHAAVCAKVVNEVSSKRVHIVAHSMGAAIGLFLPDSLRNSILTFANLEGNLISEDCGLVSRKTSSVSFQKFLKEVLPDLKDLSKSLGEGRFFLDKSLPLGFYKSADSLVHWSCSGELILRFKKLSCRKSYFYGESNSDMVVLNQLNSIEKVLIANAGHFMMNDNPNEFYSRLRTFLGPQ